ncbi:MULTISPECIES: hypothetical protein [unclassified Oceanispirochaeta]|uniref:hypothetical protein n=1 Tax=unclassified Oceanispirochaeta TaxID=2635722 RepID=UPI000E08D8D9|nr:MULTISPECIES: hypothetical protein [unclassified Oceanispirochaeta]MBF9018629.1 hypothetical protein [Oceanispirochaeta sp. M2]NPD75066.1 hypothetical protein [Oceanispirochaeta sp. M1]RDG29092.1 hypothetical protein DV872_23500 [Oceanispirochaeta sp. M1]
MSFRFYPERVDSIGQKSGVVSEDLLIPIPGIDGMRITIPQLSVSCGANAQNLTLLQVKEQDLMSVVDVPSKTITTEEIDTDLADRLIALETLDGDWLFLKVTSSAAKDHTFTEDISNVKTGGRFLLIAEETDDLNQRIPLASGEETLVNDNAPGRLFARDFCYPVVISITNETTAVEFNSASVVYICK